MRKYIGMISVVLGSLVLSMEIYGLKFIQGFEMTTGSWLHNAFRYITDPVVSISIAIVIIVILYGISLIFKK